MMRRRGGGYRWLPTVVAAAVLLPGSYFGVTEALGHLGGRGEEVASATGCQDGCGATPVAASPLSSASPAKTTPAPGKSHTPAAHASKHPSHTAKQDAAAVPHPSSPATSSNPNPGSGSPPPAPHLAARYQTQSEWLIGFTGEFTVVNNGSRPISSWQLRITLPGDTLTGAVNGNWSQDGDVVTLVPYSGQGVIQPGGQQTITFTADGLNTAPSNCTVNGAACS